MSHPQPTPQDDDQTPVAKLMRQSLADCTMTRTDKWFIVVDKLLADLALAGYELVSQVGTVHESPEGWSHVAGGSHTPTATDDQVINPTLVESIAQWLGERESTHLWPEIHESDKACYRDSARHLVTTVKFGLAAQGLSLNPEDRKIAADALEAIGPSATTAAETGMRVAQRATDAAEKVRDAEQVLKDARQAGALAGRDWLARMLENTNTVCVQIPEPDEHGCWYIDGTNNWLVHTTGSASVFFETSVDLYELTPTHARNIAAALLAGAARAEASE